jgi:hypothetical protein
VQCTYRLLQFLRKGYRIVGGETTIYVGARFEKNVSTGKVTKSYTLGDRRVATEEKQSQESQ